MQLHWVNGLDSNNKRLDIKFNTKEEALNMFSSLMEQIDRIQGELFLGCNLTVSFGNNTDFKDFLGKDFVPMGCEQAWIKYEAPVIAFDTADGPQCNPQKVTHFNIPGGHYAAEYTSTQKVSHK